MIENDTFPRFSIFVGPRGSGKKTLLLEMFEGIYLEDNKVDSVRKMIEMVYRIGNRTFIMPNADTMSNAARNALLKVIEECPNNNYFIMTLEDENNTLETIRSRGTIFHMDRYTPDEIGSYFYDKYHANHGEDEEEIVRELCDTPGDVDTLVKMSIHEFYDYVQLVVDNIAEVGLANAFKIPSKVALKDDADGYDLKLFWKAFASVMMERAKDLYFTDKANEAVPYLSSYNATRKCIQSLNTKGINRQMLMDTWILEVRRIFGVM